MKTEWQNQWNNVPSTNKLKSIRPYIKHWNTSNQDRRIKEVILTRMRIGHTRLTHNHLFTKSAPPICQCGAPLSVRHILSCHRHDHIRSSLHPPPSLGDDEEGVTSLFTYLQQLDIYHMI
ncbi:hypothetical protein M8J77_000213 [Diaphorina citri]|nr:hypothetical protein M8J77_010264 [Diaphorina citri]KAI5746155.1 hypothetical protein M8J77_000539 [Diaphorina citri]KAI5753439.1 hypothetical protein M8J77_000213 [Diaphorina citri]